ncbi:MAG: 2-dehydropantoate 2-reductase [Pseudomonadota bacterium]|nr:2-dehydropantoate 2-reductase [Pseudomonadota bacterium]
MTESSSPTFAIMGSGGMGGYIGAKLTQAGYKVSFIARGAHLEAMKNNGLKIEGPDESFVIDPIRATNDPREIGPVDFVIFCVKLWDTEAAGEQCRDLVGPDTAVLSMQNGVDPEPILGRILGCEHVMGAVSEIGANIIKPGFVRRFTPFAIIRFGELDQSRSARSIQISEAITAAGLEADHVDSINLTIWDKFLWLVGASALNCVTRQPFGPVREDPDTRALLRQIMQEVMAVANAKDIPLANENIEARLDYIDNLPGEAKVSMAVDLERGNQLELPWLSGAVVRMGQELGIPTPANNVICAALKHYVMGSV